MCSLPHQQANAQTSPLACFQTGFLILEPRHSLFRVVVMCAHFIHVGTQYACTWLSFLVHSSEAFISSTLPKLLLSRSPMSSMGKSNDYFSFFILLNPISNIWTIWFEHLNLLSPPWNTFILLGFWVTSLLALLHSIHGSFPVSLAEVLPTFFISTSGSALRLTAQASSLLCLTPWVILPSPMALVSSKCWKFPNLYLQQKLLSPEFQTHMYNCSLNISL